jgi:hypothetical protein
MTADRSQLGRRSRTKGATFEREISKALAEIMPDEKIQRGIQSRFGGREYADVECPFFHVECKRGKKTNIKAAMRQAIDDLGDKPKMPVAITRDDRESALVTMLLDDWLELVAEWYQRGKS